MSKLRRGLPRLHGELTCASPELSLSLDPDMLLCQRLPLVTRSPGFQFHSLGVRALLCPPWLESAVRELWSWSFWRKDEFGRMKKSQAWQSFLSFLCFIFLFLTKRLSGKLVSRIAAIPYLSSGVLQFPPSQRFLGRLGVCFLFVLAVPFTGSLAWLIAGLSFRSKQLPGRSFKFWALISENTELLPATLIQAHNQVPFSLLKQQGGFPWWCSG